MARGDRIPLQRFHVRLLKTDVTRVDAALDDPRGLRSYEIRGGLGLLADFMSRLRASRRLPGLSLCKPRDAHAGWETRVPVGRPRASDYSVVLAILGAGPERPGLELPFFSQLNLARTGEALLNLGFSLVVKGVEIAG
jgi:hypothetical protein